MPVGMIDAGTHFLATVMDRSSLSSAMSMPSSGRACQSQNEAYRTRSEGFTTLHACGHDSQTPHQRYCHGGVPRENADLNSSFHAHQLHQQRQHLPLIWRNLHVGATHRGRLVTQLLQDLASRCMTAGAWGNIMRIRQACASSCLHLFLINPMHAYLNAVVLTYVI